ncbi:MAG: ComEC/Rec2 family competence protein [Oscillospiraceae bacterium]
MKIRKKDKKLLLTALVLLIFGGISIAFPQLFDTHKPVISYGGKMENQILSLHIIDVGQGSAALIKTADKAVLIDGGESFNSKMVTDYLSGEGIEEIDIVVGTHPHSDHYGGIPDVLANFKVNNIILPKLTEKQIPENKTWEQLMLALSKTSGKITYKDKKETYDLGGGAVLELLGPFLKDEENLNNLSLCFKITVGDASFLITGDGETAVEDALRKNEDIDVDVLVAGHHGSATSSRTKFLNAVTPKISAVSVGENNKYSLPNEQVMERLHSFGEVFRTDFNGSVVFMTDGKSISVMTENEPTKITNVAA